MVRAEDLRIGNIIRDSNFEQHVVVLELYERSIKGHISGTIVDSIERYEDLSGVPLTEEWLLKFGFTHKGLDEEGTKEFEYDGRFKYSIGGDLYYCPMGDKHSYGHFMRCEFVHQLQNLIFVLCGELTIKSKLNG